MAERNQREFAAIAVFLVASGCSWAGLSSGAAVFGGDSGGICNHPCAARPQASVGAGILQRRARDGADVRARGADGIYNINPGLPITPRNLH